MRRKITIIILFILIFVGLIIYFTQGAESEKGNNGTRFSACYDAKGGTMNCKKCLENGRSIVSDASYVCEIEARDALKSCIYNEECVKGCAYQNASSTEGKCRAFKTNTYDGLGLCGRERGEAGVNCNTKID